jgi:hypothetical protein
MNKQLVYAEVIDSVTEEMRDDKDAVIISDGAIFLVTTEENKLKFPQLEFADVHGLVSTILAYPGIKQLLK